MMQQVKTVCLVSVLLIVTLVWRPTAVRSQETATGVRPQPGNAIQPPDIYALTLLLRQELDVLRHEMGKPHDRRPAVKVRNAQPREVFFQALTLFQKANRLCFEFTHNSEPMPRLPRQEIQPGHVWNVVHAALSRIVCVKTAVGVTQRQQAPPRDATKTPTDVFKSIVHANRQLNILLEHQFTPAEVFSQVQLANAYTADVLQILRRFGEEKSMKTPELPPYEPEKRPVDVYKRLANCYTLIAQIAQASGLKVLEFGPDIGPTIVPSDVYDMASLIVSEVRYFSVLIGGQTPAAPSRPRRKLPSHVLQRAGFLEAQLLELRGLIQRYPNWHTSRP